VVGMPSGAGEKRGGDEGSFVAGTCGNRTTIKGDDVEPGDLREWTLVDHRNISICDLRLLLMRVAPI
jgi:hypothetical protein